MANKTHDYRWGAITAPPEFKRWHLRGAGLEMLTEETVAASKPGPDELFVRHDACGICFSDIKIINLGPEHPRLQGRDMRNNPVVMGHEVALTVIEVGANLQELYHRGQRFIVQADVYFHGANVAYGYQLAGGFAQYGIVTKEVLDGDEGCYLIPIQDRTGYVEAALVEPWACVVAAYDYGNFRDGLVGGGRLLVVGGATEAGRAISLLATNGHEPAHVRTVDPRVAGSESIRVSDTDGAGFDDIIVVGAKSPGEIAQIASLLGKQGILLSIGAVTAGRAAIDIGRIHYEQQLYIGAPSIDDAPLAYRANTRRDIKPNGSAWFVGGGGPMGQMHVQRAVMLENPPRRIVVTDTSDNRLDRIRARFGSEIAKRDLELILLNPTRGENPASYAPYDDIVALVPSPQLVSETIVHLAENGVYNIFAGVAKGVTADLEIGSILAKNQRIVGTSGSSVDDLRKTLGLVESGRLSTNSSLAAIGGMPALRDGLAAVKAGQFPGKTVIFPNMEALPLMAIDELELRLPAVHAKLKDGIFWSEQAELELLKEYL